MKNNISRKLKSYLEISSFERRGLFSLLFIFSLVSGYYYLRNSQPDEVPYVDQKKLEEFKQSLKNGFAKKSKDQFGHRDDRGEKILSKKDFGLLPFNPNSDDFKLLLKKGVPYSVVKNLINYRNKGGVFKSKDDVKKLYSVDDNLFLRLKPYILLPDSIFKVIQVHSDRVTIKIEPLLVSINTASESDLDKIKGIGPTYAKRIIERREQLGGFTDSSQLSEVYGLTEETIERILPYLAFEGNDIRKIHLNSGDIKSLASHPYLSYGESKAIVNYRIQHGSFAKINDITRMHIFRGKDIDRILPYLDLN
ncbi:MAG: hypothetical protein COA58_08745 [Bacteroidetes bacterium]|nr:MAG: hypothetical protein COA58_08745 [Bacteroidota bacterium]